MMKILKFLILFVSFLFFSQSAIRTEISIAQQWGGSIPPKGSIYERTPYFYYPYPIYYYPWVPYDPYKWQVTPAGSLVVHVDPLTAAVFVDGYRLTQQVDLSYEVGLLIGRHRVEARAEGYEVYEREIDIPTGQRVILPIKLNRKD